MPASVIATIAPKVVRSLEGSLPNSFSELEGKIFYQVVPMPYGNSYWVPKTSITDTANDPEVNGLDCWKQLKEAFDANPGYSSITLSNL